MASFDTAYNITLEYEGGYSNDPDDVGQETYKGISRKYCPNWKGWKIIDGQKSKTDFPDCLDSLTDLQVLVHDYFKKTYWDVFQGDNILDQAIANEMYDTAVNMGAVRAVSYLQIGLNILNRNQQSYPDISEDGQFGAQTLLTLKKYLAADSNECLLKVMIILRGMHYIDYVKKNPKQEKFMRGWLGRLGI
jgi:lysozyme family protein